MKKSLLITLLLIPFLGFSQTTKPIEGFLGVKFGASKAEVVAAIQAKGGASSTSSDPDQLIFTDAKFGSRTTIYVFAYFFNDKLFEGVLVFKPDLQPQSVDYYNALVNDISSVYGPGKPIKDFKSPYKDGDGEEILALTSGSATFFTNWGNDHENTIQVVIKPLKDDLYVKVFYIDEATQAKAIAAKKAKEKSDY